MSLTEEADQTKQGWSVNMVAFVLSSIATFAFWSLAVGQYRLEQQALKRALEDLPEVAAPQPAPIREERPEFSIVGLIVVIVVLAAALTIFIWTWKNGVFIHPQTVLMLTVCTLFSLAIVSICALESLLALPEFFIIAPYTVQNAPGPVLIFLIVIAAIWVGAIALQRLEDQLTSGSTFKRKSDEA